MLNILIVCNAGMSSGILARKMQDASEGKAYVRAVGVSDYQNHLDDMDVILVGPQIRFQLADIESHAGIPALTINLKKYGVMDAEGILQETRQYFEGTQ